MIPKLLPQVVTKTFTDCLFEDDEDKTIYIAAKGIMNNVGFHPGRIEENKPKILELLQELPVEFKEGWSFLNACVDKHGNLWTGEHLVMEQLMLLGMAAGYVTYCLEDRELWTAFHGGMPYIQTKLD